MSVLNNIPGVCTGKHLHGMSFSAANTTAFKTQIRGLVSLPALIDYAFVICYVTERQLPNAKPILDTIGFKEVFVGSKDIDPDQQRHQETGDIHVFCCDTGAWATKNSRLMEKFLLPVPPRKGVDITKTPRFTLSDFKRKYRTHWGNSCLYAELDDSISTYRPFRISSEDYYGWVYDTWGIDLTSDLAQYLQHRLTHNSTFRTFKLEHANRRNIGKDNSKVPAQSGEA